MKLNFTFKHLDRSEALEAHTQQAMEDIARFLLKEGQGQVLYSKQSHSFVVEISVNTKQRYFRASAENADPYLAVDEAIMKLGKQFLKTRNKLHQTHKKPGLSREGRLDQMNDRFEVRSRFKKAA